MTTRNTTFTVHPALGGLDVSSDPSTLDPNFLTVADNIEYLEGGQRKKRLGTQIYSTSTGNTNPSYLVSSSAAVRAVSDYWRYGATITPTQNLISVVGASIFTSTGDGKWAAITSTSSFGAAANVQTVITPAGDNVVISDETAAPIAYNQTVLVSATSASAWPRFTATSYHLSRLFYYGLSTTPSSVGYTAAGNIFDSTGSDTGTFPVNTGDGDQVMAVSKPFFAALYVFKGPQFGSVWQLTGATPSTFSMVQVGYGAPILNPRALITTPTDIYWFSQYGVHSLETTVKFGNVEQAFLSLPIQRLWRDNVIDRKTLNQTWGFWHPQRNLVGWVVTPIGDTAQRWILAYNYALSDPKPGGRKFWSIWKYPAFGLKSGTTVLIPATWGNGPGGRTQPSIPAPLFGGDTGTIYVGDWATLGDAGNAYSARIKTPTMMRFSTRGGAIPETQEKGFVGVTTYFNPKGNYGAGLAIVVDKRSQSQTIALGGGGTTLT